MTEIIMKQGKVDIDVLKQVQSRREWQTRLIQRVQVILHNGIQNRRNQPQNTRLPLFLNMLNTFPVLRRIPARLVGMGIRPEHVRTPDVKIV